MENLNSKDYLEKIRTQVVENLSRTKFAPSVQLTDVPRDPEGFNDEDGILDDMEEDGDGADRRYTQRRWDQRVGRDDELSDSEDEGMNGGRRQNGAKRRRNERNYRETGQQSGSASGIGTPVIPTSALSNQTNKTASGNEEAADDMDIEIDEDSLPTSALRDALNSKLAEKEVIAPEDEDDDIDMGDAVDKPSSTNDSTNKSEVTDPGKSQEMEVDQAVPEPNEKGKDRPGAPTKAEAVEAPKSASPSLPKDGSESSTPANTTEKS